MVNPGSHGKLIMTNNIEIPVLALVTTCNGVDRPSGTGKFNNGGVKRPLALGYAMCLGNHEALSGILPKDSSVTVGGSKFGCMSKGATFGGLLTLASFGEMTTNSITDPDVS